MLIKSTCFSATHKLSLVNNLLSGKESFWCCFHVPLQLLCCCLLHLCQIWPGVSATKIYACVICVRFDWGRDANGTMKPQSVLLGGLCQVYAQHGYTGSTLESSRGKIWWKNTSGGFCWRSENAIFPISFLHGHPVEWWHTELSEKGICSVPLSEKNEAFKVTKYINFVLFVNLLAIFQTVLM